jgi:tRNA nucleotidyltransferase (CCA-adding enzyme)
MVLRNYIRTLLEAAEQETIDKVVQAIQQAGGEIYTVGGIVRDEILGKESKDVDFLVRKLDFAAIKKALASVGKVTDQNVGGKLSMLLVHVDGESFDIAIPRTSEVKTGEGHNDVDITLDPHASVESDLGRRDFTFNALAKDARGNIIDNFGGMDDIKAKLVRAVGNPENRFKEDALRMLRGIQFATRFDFDIEPKTKAAIIKLAPLLNTISSERILKELEKAWTKGSENTEVLVSLLNELGIGEVMFGADFDPIPIKVEGDNHDKVLGNFVAFFVNGGTPPIKSKERKQLLSVAKKARANTPEIWTWAKKEQLPLLIKVFTAIGETEVADRLSHTIKLPLSGNELAIGGRELMQLGFKPGPVMGQFQGKALQAIHDGSLTNDRDALISFAEGMLE